MSSVIVTWQVPTPVQPPPVHPSTVVCSPGTAVRVTTVPAAKEALQGSTGAYFAVVQLIPAGFDVTVPVASMNAWTRRVKVCACAGPAVRARTASTIVTTDDTRPPDHLTPEHTRTSRRRGSDDTPEFGDPTGMTGSQ